jgi:hypothetical protein
MVALSGGACGGHPEAPDSGTDSGPGPDTGGQDVVPPVDAGGTLVLIDDMEQNTGSIDGNAPNLVGAWYTYNDGTAAGSETPPAGAPFADAAIKSGDNPLAPGSLFIAEMKGSGFTTWGAGMGFDLHNPGGDAGVAQAYDATKYKAFVFYAKVGTGTASVRFNVHTMNTDAAGTSGCTGTGTSQCNDDFGENMTFTQSWASYTVNFTDLNQQGFGKKATWDPNELLSIHFQVGKGTTFDIMLDNIYFLQ